MITISLTLNVQLDAADLAAFDARLGAIARGVAMLAAPTVDQPQRHEEHQEQPKPDESLRGFVVGNPPTTKPQKAPKRPKTEPRPPRMPALPRTPVLPAIPAVEGNFNGTDEMDRINKSHVSHLSPATEAAPETDAHPSTKLPFAEFDKLVRSEIKRLSMDGRLPGHKLWNNERDPRLPTMAAILLRYGTTTLIDLAKVFSLQPPLSVVKEGQP